MITVYPKKNFPSKETVTKILQCIYFAYYVGRHHQLLFKQYDQLRQGRLNVLTRGPNWRSPGHWKTEYSGIYVIYAKIGC